MKKEDLIKIGLTEEQAETLEQEFENYVPKKDYDEVLVTKEDLEEQLKGRNSDIEELKKSAGDNSQLLEKYVNLEEKYKNEIQALTDKISFNAKNSAVDMAIMQAKGKNTKAIKALIDMDTINLKEDGTLEGLDLEGLKTNESYLFDIEKTTRVGTGFIAGGGSNLTTSLEEQVSQAMGIKTN